MAAARYLTKLGWERMVYTVGPIFHWIFVSKSQSEAQTVTKPVGRGVYLARSPNSNSYSSTIDNWGYFSFFSTDGVVCRLDNK